MLNIVLDTNVLLVSVSSKSPYHWVYRHLIEGQYQLCLTTAIAHEYESILTEHMSAQVAGNVLEFLEMASNVNWINRYYRWNLIEVDPDDNKFVDCAVAGRADFLVTEDKHFNVLKKVFFPKINIIGVDEFQKYFNRQQDNP